jgi:hypothetical protein
MKIHCDKCGRYLGDYFYGKGGIVERAIISGGNLTSMPDVICFKCDNNPFRWNKNDSSETYQRKRENNIRN